MTALCGGGSSGPNTGTAALVAIGSAAIAQALERSGAPEALPVVPFLVLPEILLSSFCASDPPTPVALTANEANAVLKLTLGSDFSNGLAKLANLVEFQFWYDNCHCTSGSLVPQTPAPAWPPTAVVIIQPTPQPAVACATGQIFTSVGGGSVDYAYGVSPSVGSSATSVLSVLDIAFTSGTGTITFAIQFRDQNQQQISISPATTYTSGNVHLELSYSVPPNTVFYYAHVITSGSLLATAQLTLSVFCGGAPPVGVQQPCCPPDATTQATLNAILQLVTLMQRQLVPFGSVGGATHSSLSGSGSVAVPRLLGVKVHVSTLPSHYGVALGNPDIHFDLGFLSIFTPDGFIDERRVNAVDFAWYPSLMSDAVSVNYFLNPGVVISIQEIETEV